MNPHAMFVSDLDGTLLRRGRITPQDRDAFASLSAHGIMPVIATGRALHSLRNVLEPEFPVEYVILSSGNQIINWRTGTVLFSTSLTQQQTEEISCYLHACDVSFMLHAPFPDNHRHVFHRATVPPEDFERRLCLYREHGRILDGPLSAASQCVAIVDTDAERVYACIVRDLPHLSIIRATSPLDGSSTWIEIFTAGVSKSHGIRRIIQQLGQDRILTAAIGNDHNDRDMLEYVHMPFLVRNAFLNATDTYIRTTDGDDAVAVAIEHFMAMIPTLSRQTCETS